MFLIVRVKCLENHIIFLNNLTIELKYLICVSLEQNDSQCVMMTVNQKKTFV